MGIDANLDQAKKLAKANAMKKLKKRREFQLIRLRKDDYKKIMKEKKDTAEEGEKEIESEMANMKKEDEKGWGKLGIEGLKSKVGTKEKRRKEEKTSEGSGWGFLDNEDEERF